MVSILYIICGIFVLVEDYFDVYSSAFVIFIKYYVSVKQLSVMRLGIITGGAPKIGLHVIARGLYMYKK